MRLGVTRFLRRAITTSKIRTRAIPAIVNISHLSQFLEYSNKIYRASLLMILFTMVILKPPNNARQKAGFEKGLLTTSPYLRAVFNTTNNPCQTKKSYKINFLYINMQKNPKKLTKD